MLTEGARKIYHGRHGARGRRVGQGWYTGIIVFQPDTQFIVMKCSATWCHLNMIFNCLLMTNVWINISPRLGSL
jgi:hypothetical protein